MGTAFAAFLIILLGAGNPPLPYRRGQVATSDIRARVSFTIVDDQSTKAAREAAAAATPNVYRVDRAPFDRSIESLRAAVREIADSRKFEDVSPEKAQALGITRQLYDVVKPVGSRNSEKSVLDPFSQAIGELVRRGCLSASDAKLEQTRTKANGITVLEGPERRFRPLSSLVRAEDLKSSFRKELAALISADAVVAALADYAEPNLKPFLAYDAAESDAARNAARDSVVEAPVVYDRGDILVRRDSLLDHAEIARLRKEHEVYLASIPARDRRARLLGMAITVSFLVWLFGSYVSRYQPRVLVQRSRILILMALAVALVAITRLFIRSSLSWHLIPISLLGMAVAVAYSPLFAVGYTLFLAILVGITTGGDFALAVSLFAGSTMGILAIGKVHSRTAPFLAGVLAGTGTFLATWGTGLLFHAGVAYSRTLSDSAYGLVNGVICGAIITVMLPFVERTFNVVTQLSLLELADLNKPVLRRLALEAPGSYNHSLMVGTLAEAAAEAVGADPLLAKTGGYYHDIGKLSKPDYFIENRGNSQSRHGSLSPTMSALIIIAHVKDGVEIARECRVPPPVVDIIRQHHGTTLVEYFYHEAAEQAADGRQVSDQSFRYPGPKPQTSLAAIVMLADSVESAARALTEPTPGKLEALVHDIVQAKLADGQFEECEVTMAQLKRIETSLMKSLAGIFHARIKYPGHEL